MDSNNQLIQTLSRFVTRSYRMRIKPNNPLYPLLDDLSFKAKNLYNLATYHSRQLYIESKQFYKQFDLNTILKNEDAFKSLPSKVSQSICIQVYRNFKSFQALQQDFFHNPSKYKGRPKLPKYKDKSKGRSILTFDYQTLKIKDSSIHLPKKLAMIPIPAYLNGIQIKTDSIVLYTPTPELQLLELKVIPTHNSYELHFIYSKHIQIPVKPKLHVASIDLGLDNFAAIAFSKANTQPILLNGKGLKSYNQLFNKTLANLKSKIDIQNNTTKQHQRTSKRIQQLYDKRNRYLNTWMHQASRRIITLLQQNDIQVLVIGHNKHQKQQINLGSKTNQTFVQIPYTLLINQLTYKCEEAGIQLIVTEESYTSGTSFLDNEPPTQRYYNPSRRKHRGLFISNDPNHPQINADINAAYQILKKAFSSAQYVPTLRLDPIKINVS